MSTPEEQVQQDAAAAEQTPAAAESGDAELETLRNALTAAETRANEARDQALRALAELDNVRKRATRDIEQAHKYALEKFAGELVGVKDTLEMGLAMLKADVKDLRAGSEATLKLLAKAFEKAGIAEISPEGEPFNPEFHEAMAAQPSADHAPNTVIAVVQKGYQLNGRLVRPARVLVARAPD
jgi:molecular chaperone GrpE